MQTQPLLEQLDWFFTSYQWTLSYPNSIVLPLGKTTSDHTPCVVSISTKIPKAKIFRFENHWVEQPGFFELVKDIWSQPVRAKSSANVISAKLKNLRHALKKWGKSLSHIRLLIANCNRVIFLLDQLEDEGLSVRLNSTSETLLKFI
jgi:hypothetical protein